MVLQVPAAVPSDGTVALKWVPAIADTSAPKLATEINAAGAVALECYLKENFSPGADAQTAEDRRMCSKQVFATPGTVTYTIEALVGTYDPQDPTGTTEASKAYAALVPGAKGFLVARWGIDLEGADAAWTAGQFVDVYPVTIASRSKVAPEQNSQLQFRSVPVITGSVAEDVALVA